MKKEFLMKENRKYPDKIAVMIAILIRAVLFVARTCHLLC